MEEKYKLELILKLSNLENLIKEELKKVSIESTQELIRGNLNSLISLKRTLLTKDLTINEVKYKVLEELIELTKKLDPHVEAALSLKDISISINSLKSLYKNSEDIDLNEYLTQQLYVLGRIEILGEFLINIV